MVKIIKTENSDVNYIYDKSTDKVLDKYDPNNKNLILLVSMDNESVLNVEADSIKNGYGGEISFEYQNNKYIIDDGYQDLLIRCGYIVLNNYDIEKISPEEKTFGVNVRSKLQNYVYEIVSKMWSDKELDTPVQVSKSAQEIKMLFVKDGFEFTVKLDTINSIVNKNQQRKTNSLPFYPFIKDMDKYGTMYLSIFCKKLEKDSEYTQKYRIAEDTICTLIDLLNEYAENNDKYRFERIIVKKRINNWQGI